MTALLTLHDHVSGFKERITDTWLTPRGVTFSEGFAVAAMMKCLDVDLIIESGTAYGGSTEMVAQMCPEIPIITIDTFTLYEDSEEYVRDRLKDYTNVKIVQGNSFEEIERILNYLPPHIKKIGVFIDGPKGEPALILAHSLSQDKRVKVLAMHDMKHTSPHAPACMALWPHATFWDAGKQNIYNDIKREIDNHMLELNKKLTGPTPSSLNRDDGQGNLQAAMAELSNGSYGLMITPLNVEGYERPRATIEYEEHTRPGFMPAYTISRILVEQEPNALTVYHYSDCQVVFPDGTSPSGSVEHLNVGRQLHVEK